MLRSTGLGIATVLACAAATLTSRAATLEYRLDLPAEGTLAYVLEFEVARAGVVTLSAEWSSSRVLVLRLEREGRPPLRRSGTSPLRLELAVEESDLRPDSPWTVTLSGLPSRRAATGRLLIELPEATGEGPAAPTPRPQHTAASVDTWQLEAERPTGLGPARSRLYDATEHFRQLVVNADAPDGYRWQDPLLRFLASRRDQPGPDSKLAPSTRGMLRRLVEATRELDELRRQVTAPVLDVAPAGGIERRVWDRLRDPRFTPLGDELDALLEELHAGHMPELERHPWASSLLSCVIVCGRHFEQRTLVVDEEASRGEIVRQQWPAILAAAEALAALSDLP